MNLKQETVKLSIVTGITTFLGFLFHILLGRRFGISYHLDCFFVVLTLFAFLGLFNSLLTSLFIPIFNEVKKDNFKDSILFVDVVVKWSVLVSLFIIIITLLFNNLIIRLLASGFIQRDIALSVEINQIIIFGLIFFGISSVVISALNALYYYFIPALTGLLHPILNISAIFVLTPTFGIKGIAISYLLANFLIASILLIYLHFKTGWNPTLRFYHRKFPELVKKSSRMTLATFIWSFRNIITRNVASRLGEGAVALFAYAEKIITILTKVTIEPFAKVFYSRVSEWISLSKLSQIRGLFMRLTRLNLLLSLFISSGLIIFLSSLLSLLFRGSRFISQDIHMLSIIFNIMIIYFVIESFQAYLSRIIFAMKRTGAAIIITIAGISALLVCALFLTARYGIYGLAISVPFSQAITCLLCYLFTKPVLQIRLPEVIRIFSNSFIIAFVFGFLGIIITGLIESKAVIVFIALPIWLAAYLLFVKLFMKEEVKTLLSR